MNFLSLCSGCGGMDLGLEKAGMKCVGQVDIMKFAQRILKRFPKAGMGVHGVYWTVDISTKPNDARECSLLDVLEKSPHPRFYMSHKGASGMIRRTMKHHPTASVLQLNQEPGMTPVLKPLSVERLRVGPASITLQTIPSSAEQSSGKTAPSTQCAQISSEKQSTLKSEEATTHGETIILRQLTTTEKERLQGLPDGWTDPEVVLSATQLLLMSRNGSAEEL